MGRKKREGVEANIKREGWPKVLPCLGWCGKAHRARHPGDRFCADCRRIKERAETYPIARFG